MEYDINSIPVTVSNDTELPKGEKITVIIEGSRQDLAELNQPIILGDGIVGFKKTTGATTGWVER